MKSPKAQNLAHFIIADELGSNKNFGISSSYSQKSSWVLKDSSETQKEKQKLKN